MVHRLDSMRIFHKCYKVTQREVGRENGQTHKETRDTDDKDTSPTDRHNGVKRQFLKGKKNH